MNQIAGRLEVEAEAVPHDRTRPPSTRDFSRLRLRLYAFLVLADAGLMATAFLLANLLRYGQPLESYGINTFIVLWPIYLAVGLNGGAYSIEALSSARRSVSVAVQALLFAIAVATGLFFTLKIGEDFSRLVFGIGSVASLLFIMMGRSMLGRVIGRRCGWTFRREVLLVDGVPAGRAGSEAVVDAEREGLRPAIDDPVMLMRLSAALEGCERVVLACPAERRPAWSRILAGANVDVELLAPELDEIGALGLGHHGNRSTLLVGCGPLGLRDRALKRAFDFALSALALFALLPLFALIAASIKLESPGPIFFAQARMGRGNRLFRMLKFRSMRCEAADPEGVRSASRDDDRVTAVGRFLRRTSLDELPQIINVLKGEMSIVGPRPHALGSTAEESPFWMIDERYWDRHAIKPGLTGLAQVRGFRGATARRSDLTDRLQADLEYLDGWSVGRDLAIIARTLSVMVHRNAY